MVPWQTVPDYTIHGNTCCSLVEMIGQGTGLRFISRTPATLYSVIVMTGNLFSITASMKVPASGEEWKLAEWRMQRLNTRICLITNRQPLFRICITLPVESAPFFIPSTSFCSLTFWFTSSCAYHLITVTSFALITLSLPRPFTPDLKLIFLTNPILHSHSYSFRTAFTDS